MRAKKKSEKKVTMKARVSWARFEVHKATRRQAAMLEVAAAVRAYDKAKLERAALNRNTLNKGLYELQDEQD